MTSAQRPYESATYVLATASDRTAAGLLAALDTAGYVIVPRDARVAVEKAPAPRIEGAPAVWMDQRGNYWRAYPAGDPHPTEPVLSMCPTSTANYASAPIEVYRTGRDLSAEDVHTLLAHIEDATEDEVLRRAARGAMYAWVAGRDAITEAEILLHQIGLKVGVELPLVWQAEADGKGSR